jgi:hypothetical protein
VLFGGGLALWLQVRRGRRGADAVARLTPDEEARLAALISADTPPRKG